MSGCLSIHNEDFYRRQLPTGNSPFSQVASLDPATRRAIAAADAAPSRSQEKEAQLRLLEESQASGPTLMQFMRSHVARPLGAGSVCLAASGGGIRSAAFSYGVLGALGKRVDGAAAISGVSGGAYAVSSLYVDTIPQENKDARLLSQALSLPDGIVQKIEANPTFIPYLHMGVGGVSLGVSTPLSLIGFSFGRQVNLAHLNTQYASRIRNFWFQGLDVPWSQWRNVTMNPSLPTPIILTAAYPQPVDGPSTFRSRVYEWLPSVRGNLALGYTDSFESSGPLWLSNVVAISGAALDNPVSSNLDLLRTLGLSAGGTEELLGAMLDADRLSAYLAHQLPDYPQDRHWIPREVPTGLNRSMNVQTDGGFADNLGVYPLIRRGCETIVVIDAEHDPELTFCGLAVLRQGLSTHHDITLTAAPSEMHAKVLGPNAMTVEACKADDSQSYFERAKKQTPPPPFKARTEPVEPFVINVSPCGGQQTSGQRLVYVKLSRPALLEQPAQAHLQAYEQQCARDGKACQFPHDVTRTINYSRDQFKAYRLLGQSLGAKALKHLP